MNHKNNNVGHVAIISAYYKRKEAVKRTLRSIRDQTYKNFTALIWDDCSSDGTWEELKRTRDEVNDDRFVVFQNNPNLGLTAGLNNAFLMTDADYVAVVGSGDVCHPERLSRQVAALAADPDAVFCATNSISVDEVNGNEFTDSSFDKPIITKDDLRRKVPFTHGSVMYKRRAVLDAGLYETTFKWCADWDLFLRLCDFGHGVYLPESYYRRYAMLDGVSFNPGKSMEQIEYKYLAKMLANSASSERQEILRSAREDLGSCVRPFREEIARDIWKRQVKLVFMGRLDQSNELGLLMEEKYGRSALRTAGTHMAHLLRHLPVSTSLLINVSRGLTRFYK